MTETPPRRRRRWLIPIVLVTLAVLANISLATYVFFFYDGSSKDLAPGRAQILSDRISNFFCSGEEIQLETGDSSLHFDASVIPGKRLNDRVPQTDSLNLSPTIKGNHNYVFWSFYLPSDARINIQQCTTGSSSGAVMSVIMKGKSVDAKCAKYLWTNYVLSYDYDDDVHNHVNSFSSKSCPDIFVPPKSVKRCGDSKQQISAKVDDEGFYSVLYNNAGSKEVQVLADISISRLTYDLRSSLANCSSTKACVLPLRILSSDTVVAQVAMTSKVTMVPVKWSCVRQSATFATVFAAVPLLILVLIISAISCRRKKKRYSEIDTQSSSTPVQDTPRQDHERTPLLDNAEVKPNVSTSYGAAAPDISDPILRKTGPIPGPYLYRPSAPPIFSPEIPGASSPEVEQPTAFPREPPPTYEETMKSQSEDAVTNETNK